MRERLRSLAVEERLTQPRRLVRHLSDLDSGRLRRLIRSEHLAPFFYAAEECPIRFHFYPSLNRPKCCSKGICTGREIRHGICAEWHGSKPIFTC